MLYILVFLLSLVYTFVVVLFVGDELLSLIIPTRKKLIPRLIEMLKEVIFLK